MMDKIPKSILDKLIQSRNMQRVVLACLIIASAFLYTGLKAFHLLDVPIHAFENKAFQMRSAFIRPPEAINKIAIVDVDEETLWKIHRSWPFSNNIHAEFLKKLSQYHPELIVFDFMFVNQSDPQGNKALKEAIHDAGNVILANRITVTGGQIVEDPGIQKAALDSGIISKPREKDNSLRRSYTYFSSEGKPVDVLSSELVTLRHDEKMNEGALILDGNYLSISSSKSGSARLPLMDYGTADINFKVNEKYFDRIPYWQVYEGKVDASQLKDKIVFVGLSSRILMDVYDTPLGLMPGSLVNAHNFMMLHLRDFLSRVPNGIQLAMLILMGLIVGFLAFETNFFRALTGALFLLAIFLGASGYFFWRDWIWDFFGPSAMFLFSFVLGSSSRATMMYFENESVKNEAVTHPLTRLYTRRFLEAKAEHEFRRVRSSRNANLSLLMIDLDHFKEVNDTLGHDRGDQVLLRTTSVMNEVMPKYAVVTHFGGDEFCVMIPDIKKEHAIQIAEDFRKAITQTRRKEDEAKLANGVTVSIGVSSVREDKLMNFEQLFKGADLAMYQSKQTRNKVTGYQEGMQKPDLGKGPVEKRAA